MVTNSFGNRNFMQPMGRPKHALKVPCYFPFKFWGVGGGEEDFFSFSLGSQCIPTMFPSNSQ
jgi:hypothetical protein